MNILCDTDVLSCFGKINGLKLLKQLFPNAVFLISTAIYEELIRCKDAGFSFPDRIFEFTKGVKSKEEIKWIISEMERKDRMVIQDIWSK